MRRPRWISYLILVLAVGPAGCASARPAGAPGAEVVDMATRSGDWPAAQHVLDTAVARLAQRCLVAHGFDAPAVALPPPPPQDEATVIDLPARRAHGYGLSPDRAAPSSQPPPDPYYDRLSAADQARYHRALFGPPAAGLPVDVGGGRTVGTPGQGCEADGRRAIGGDLTTWARLVYAPDQYDNHLSDQVATAPLYRAALAAWRSCMEGRGYRYGTPDAAQSAMREQYHRYGVSARVRRLETAVAVADGECAGQVHLPSAALTSRRALVAGLPATDRAALADLVTRRDEALRRAAAVLGLRCSKPYPCAAPAPR